jgi:hypothetical protein
MIGNDVFEVFTRNPAIQDIVRILSELVEGFEPRRPGGFRVIQVAVLVSEPLAIFTIICI